MGAIVHKFGSDVLHRYVHFSVLDFVGSPAAYLRGYRRDWSAFKEMQYARDSGGVGFRRYVETALLPIVIDGTRLSDSYRVPKLGGAITAIGSTTIVLDRLGGLYRYDLATGEFKRLSLPPLPNNVEAYFKLGALRIGLTDEHANNVFRTYGITFLSDRRELAVAYDQFDAASGMFKTAVSVIPMDTSTFTATGNWQTIFISDPYAPGAAFASGGRMAYGKNGKLYLSVGDHMVAQAAQDLNSTFGKIIEIDIAANKWRVFTEGHRNPQGLTFLRSEQLLSTEHGPRGGDELNIITEGSNYGWPNVTLGTEYESYDSNAASALVGSHDGYTPPLFAWVPSIGVSQVIELNNFHPRWDGDLLVASLKASSLYRLRLEHNRVLYSEPIWVGQRIRDLAQLEDGTIVMWTDDTQLLSIRVDFDQLAQNRRSPDVVSDATVYECMGCHHFGKTNPGDYAPTLSNLLNRRIASDDFRYSQGLRAKEGAWTEARLAKFLSNPAAFANGTNMPDLGLSEGEIKDIVKTLISATDTPADTASNR